MDQLLRCDDVVPGCPVEVRAATEEEVLRQVAEHARTAHKLQHLDATTVARIKAAIHSAA
jgi:predicted small metal-binding protein